MHNDEMAGGKLATKIPLLPKATVDKDDGLTGANWSPVKAPVLVSLNDGAQKEGG